MATSINISPSGESGSHQQALAGGATGLPATGSAQQIARLVQSIWLSVRSGSEESSPAGTSVIRSRQNIVQVSVSVPRSKASKTRLRSLRAAEMDYWNETGGDVVHRAAEKD